MWIGRPYSARTGVLFVPSTTFVSDIRQIAALANEIVACRPRSRWRLQRLDSGAQLCPAPVRGSARASYSGLHVAHCDVTWQHDEPSCRGFRTDDKLQKFIGDGFAAQNRRAEIVYLHNSRETL